MSIIKQVEEFTNYKFSLSKKSGELVVKDPNNKVLSESSYVPFLNLVAKNLGTEEDLKGQIIQTLKNRKEFAKHSHSLDYDPDYLARQESEPFVVTHTGSPHKGYKLSYYPSGHYKVGKTFQSIDMKKLQIGAHLNPDEPVKFNTIYALESYEPFISDVILMDKGKEDYFLNMYRPSLYMEIYRGYYPDVQLLDIRSFDGLPPVIQAFFLHLLPDQRDRGYLIQWLAWSIFEQCETIPILFGGEGTGKGTLNSLWARMLGINNWAPMNASGLEGEFSMAHFINKRGVSVNEGKITSDQQMENLKNSTDKFIRVNDKNEKFKTIKKTHSMIYTANHLDSIKVQGQGRRFSFLGVTNNKLPGAEIILKDGSVMKFNKENLDKINPPEEPEDLHDETFALFSYLSYLYDSKSLNHSVKNESHSNEQQSKAVSEASAPQWFTEMWEDSLRNCDTAICGKIEGCSVYLEIGVLQSTYRAAIPKPKYIPGYETIINQFRNREKSHGDVVVKAGKTQKLSRIYFTEKLRKEIWED